MHKENLLVFERIRVVVTVFSLGFIVTVMITSAVYMIVLRKKLLDGKE